ncbi:head completion/stabilization protein [Xenorhabdus thuongxuanensis]|uniref:Head protein n=1 Tax=Xenorhabdus thuongxuanensis TaxID=1873484 RepID=A0A1Q5TNR1_9GAMM|nr:head completion/stabilization protein [Xenorhabdus thuongxuanensis]OKP01868.1 head protein [Xenorhabdus thuongxuanensis]
MDFTSPEPAIEADEEITSGDFWPSIHTTDFRATMRSDGTVTAGRLIGALKNAVIETNRELASWQLQEISRGYHTLESVPASQISHESELVYLYRRAVYCTAKASLNERYRDIDTTSDGAKKADMLDPTIDDLRRDAVWAIQRIKGTTHNIVALI